MGALRDFVAEVLELEGAAVESVEPDGLDILAPAPLRSSMGWAELTRLGFGVTLAAGAVPVGLEGQWLDPFRAVFGGTRPRGQRQMPLRTPVPAPHEPERLIHHA